MVVLAGLMVVGCSGPARQGTEAVIASDEATGSYVPGWLAVAKEPPEGERWARISSVTAFTLQEAKERPERFGGLDLMHRVGLSAGHLLSVSGQALDPGASPSSIRSFERTYDGATGSPRSVALDDRGRFSVGFEFEVYPRKQTDSPFDLACINGQYVFIDRERGLWADTDGGELKPIENWEHVIAP